MDDNSIRTFSDILNKKHKHKSGSGSITEDLNSNEENGGHHQTSRTYTVSNLSVLNTGKLSDDWNTKNAYNLVYSQYSSEFENSKSTYSSNVENLKKPKHKLKFDESKFSASADVSDKSGQPEETHSKANKAQVSKDLDTEKLLTKNEDIKAVIRYIEDLKSLSKTLFENKDTQTSFKCNGVSF